MNNFGVISRGAVRLIAGEIGELQRNSQPFLPGRNIMEGAVILHETIHELHTKNKME